MQYARLTQPLDRRDPRLPALLGATDLDILQLDYPRPLAAPAPDDGYRPLPDFASGIVQQLTDLNSALFLHSNFRVITSAGWGHAYGCAEALAQQLVDGGNSDVVVAAVRGSNVLPVLEDLQNDGVDLSNLQTHEPFAQLTGDVVAADLEIGAGPLAAAFAEDARVIVAGCYDPGAPLLGAAASNYGWSWEDLDRQAGAAAAAHAVHAPLLTAETATPGEALWTPRTAHLASDAAATISSPAPRTFQAAELQDWLTAEPAAAGQFADVHWDLSKLQCQQISPHDIKIAHVGGRPATGRWKLDIRYICGYATDFWIAEGGSAGTAPLLPLQQYFLGLELPDRNVSAEVLRAKGDGHDGVLRVGCRSGSWVKCREFADLVRAALSRDPHSVWTSPADVEVCYEIWQAEIPRNAVDIAVDARPAKEWL